MQRIWFQWSGALVQPRRDVTYGYEHYDDFLNRGTRRTSKPKPKRESANLRRGVVIRARGHHYDVQLADEDGAVFGGEVWVCEVRGRLLQEKSRDTLVAVGDRVAVLQHGTNKGQIEQIEERHSVLSRQHPGESVPAEDVILANPDQMLAVFAAARPEPHLRMLDRFLAIAEANELPAVICVNKIDLSGSGGRTGCI